MALIETSDRITVQEFAQLEFPDDDQYIYELLNGELVKYSAPESRHQIQEVEGEGAIKSKAIQGLEISTQDIFSE